MTDKAKLSAITKLPKDFPFYEEIMLRHKEAVKKERDFYIDPETGLTVFTALYLYNRGSCCGSGCRHCPYRNLRS
jgi:hypothetical protein